MTRRDVYQAVTDEVLTLLEAGTVPWHRPWQVEAGVPRSLSSRRPYRGINPFLLAARAVASSFRSPWWGTYRQIAALDGQVRRGERGTLVVLWKPVDRTTPADSDDDRERSGYLLLRHYTVFNAEQADGLPPALTELPMASVEFDPIERCEEIVVGYVDGPLTAHHGGRAFYMPSLDRIVLPPRETFDSAAAYYSVRFHEMTHSTGHPGRLARPDLLENHRFGDPSYCREELVAEMGAALLCGVAGIEQTTIGNSAAYLRSWMETLRADSRCVVVAAAQAQKAADLILGQRIETDGEVAASEAVAA